MADESFFTAIAPRPQIARSFASLVREVMEHGTAPRRIKELIAVMVSWLNACEY